MHNGPLHALSRILNGPAFNLFLTGFSFLCCSMGASIAALAV